MRDEQNDRYGRYHRGDQRDPRRDERDPRRDERYSADWRENQDNQRDQWYADRNNYRDQGTNYRGNDFSRDNYRDERGYRGRSSGDYRNTHDDNKWHYDPSDYNVGGYRRNPETDHYNRFSDRQDQPAQRNYRDASGQYDYDYYESYPSYGQGAPYNDHEWGYISKQEGSRRRGVDNEDQYMSPKGRPDSSYDPDPYRR